MKNITPIAHITTPYTNKFGIPRQSGMVESVEGKIIFTPQFRSCDAVRGLENFSHIWVLWEFSGFEREKWSPTVRPPKLGGNTRLGVFATRSPNRPNSIGMSCLKLIQIDTTCKNAPILTVSGADILNGTAIYDIKPYIPFTDCKPDAKGGFADIHINERLNVIIKDGICSGLNDEEIKSLTEILSLDPRPAYQNDPTRIYGMSLYNKNIKFTVADGTLTVIEIN